LLQTAGGRIPFPVKLYHARAAVIAGSTNFADCVWLFFLLCYPAQRRPEVDVSFAAGTLKLIAALLAAVRRVDDASSLSAR